MKNYERKTPGGGVTYYLHFRQNGRLVRERMVGIPDRKSAELYMAKRQMEVAKGAVGLPTRETLTLGKALDGLLDDKKASFSAGHVKALETWGKQIKTRFGEKTPLRAVTLDTVNAWRGELLAAGESPGTINKKTDLRADGGNRPDRGKNGLKRGVSQVSYFRKCSHIVHTGFFQELCKADIVRVKNYGRLAW